MKAIFLISACVAMMAVGMAGCDRQRTETKAGVLQTKFPGQVTAGGGTSGQVLARTGRPVTDATYAGGTPGIAGGSGGTTGGAATGGTVQESGQGPSTGTTQPASAGRPGTNLPPGDMNHGAAPGSGNAPDGSRSRGEPATGVGHNTTPGTGGPSGGVPAAGASSGAPANATPPATAPAASAAPAATPAAAGR
jgi:hypothetical protein